MASGADLGLVNVGYYAIESMRLKKTYRAFGREPTAGYNPVEAGLTFVCKLKKGISLLGGRRSREHGPTALGARSASPPQRRNLLRLTGSSLHMRRSVLCACASRATYLRSVAASGGGTYRLAVRSPERCAQGLDRPAHTAS
jgi:hypothetical protein